MPNGLFGLATRDLQPVTPIAPGLPAKAFTDVRSDRLDRGTHLRHAQQPTRRPIDQPVDSLRRLLSSVEHVKIMMAARPDDGMTPAPAHHHCVTHSIFS